MRAKVIHPQEAWIDMIHEVEDRWHRGKDLPITSLPFLDKTLWGLPKRELTIVGGRPSQGKSVVLLQLAWDLAVQGKNVFFFSLEMSIMKCMERILAMQGVDNTLLTTGKISTMYDITTIKKPLNDMATLVKDMHNFKMVEGGYTMDEVMQTMADFPNDQDAVFVDYIQMVKGSSSPKFAIEEYLKEMRQMAKDKNMAVVIGSQINRGTHDGKKISPPEKWELKGSGALEEHTDNILLVHWPYHYDKDQDKDEYHVGLDKHRNGRTAKIKCKFEPQYCRIEEVQDDRQTKSTSRVTKRVDIHG